jgi:hypothetical protein
MAMDIVLIWLSGKAKYFSLRGLTFIPKIGSKPPASILPPETANPQLCAALAGMRQSAR